MCSKTNMKFNILMDDVNAVLCCVNSTGTSMGLIMHWLIKGALDKSCSNQVFFFVVDLKNYSTLWSLSSYFKHFRFKALPQVTMPSHNGIFITPISLKHKLCVVSTSPECPAVLYPNIAKLRTWNHMLDNRWTFLQGVTDLFGDLDFGCWLFWVHKLNIKLMSECDIGNGIFLLSRK